MGGDAHQIVNGMIQIWDMQYSDLRIDTELCYSALYLKKNLLH